MIHTPIGIKGDAFGQAIQDCMDGKTEHYFIEREDGYLFQESVRMYLADYAEWPELEKLVPPLLHGRLLDIGCGAGRHTLHFQNLGLEVTAIDQSPLAIEMAKKRGVKQAQALSLDQFLASSPGLFNFILLLGHNIGLLQNFQQGKQILSALYHLTTPDAKIIGTNRDPFKIIEPDHKAYCESNLKRDRMYGQMRLRSRHAHFIAEWFDFLFISQEELSQMAHDTGWYLEKFTYGNAGYGRESYLAILSKTS